MKLVQVRDLYIVIFMFVPLVMQLAGLVFAVSVDKYIGKKNRAVFIIIAVLAFALILQNIMENRFDKNVFFVTPRLWASVAGYSIRPVILVMFFYVVGAQKKWIGWLLVAINSAIYMTAFFSDICFTITRDNDFVRGPLGFTCHIVSGILLAWFLGVTISRYYRNSFRIMFIPVLNVAIIVAATLADSLFYISIQPVSFLTCAVVSCSLFYYIWLHLQFVREHEEAMKSEQRIKLMMSQIQPHFLFNTLTTIQSLCRIDPKKASEVTGNFGAYLRENLASLQQSGLVPIRREIGHTQNYARIETVRFPNVNVEYDIKDDDFSVPVLSIQPLVENAIRHGVRSCEDGLVTVETRNTEKGHEIIVRDNGTGFDPADVAEKVGDHIGIANVRERIKKMCGGTFEIESRTVEGTVVRIVIPEVKK